VCAKSRTDISVIADKILHFVKKKREKGNDFPAVVAHASKDDQPQAFGSVGPRL